MIIVTGGAGLIGSNIVAALNARGITDIMIVDHLKNGRKMRNLSDLNFSDYMDRDDFLAAIQSGRRFNDVKAVFHEGACSATTEWDGQFIMRNNFEYSKTLMNWCQEIGAQFLYASSASVYGMGKYGFQERRECEHPINMYAFSKFQFDQYVRSVKHQMRHQVVGLRYFNVYGPREPHKGSMSSTPLHFNNQVLEHGTARLFSGTEGVANGEQSRDFVYVADCVKVNLWFLDHPETSGIFNLGTGISRTFNDLAQAVLNWHGSGAIEYVPFPRHLIGSYQNYTEADISALRAAGYTEQFTSVEEGVKTYLNWLNDGDAARRGIEG